MKIDPQLAAAQNSSANRVNDATAGPPKNASTTPAVQPNDTVQLSSGQATVRQLVSQLDQVPDVRQARVDALRSQIQTGQYKPSNDQVAGAIVTQLLGGSANT